MDSLPTHLSINPAPARPPARPLATRPPIHPPAPRVSGPARLDLSHCGGVNDTALMALLPWEEEEEEEDSSQQQQQQQLLRQEGEQEGTAGRSHRQGMPASGASGSGGNHVRPYQPGRRFARWLGGRAGAQAHQQGTGQGVEWGCDDDGPDDGMMVLEELSLAGSSRVSVGALLELAQWGAPRLAVEAGRPPSRGGPLLARLQLLDLSHCECFRASTPAGRWEGACRSSCCSCCWCRCCLSGYMCGGLSSLFSFAGVPPPWRPSQQGWLASWRCGSTC